MSAVILKAFGTGAVFLFAITSVMLFSLNMTSDDEASYFASPFPSSKEASEPIDNSSLLPELTPVPGEPWTFTVYYTPVEVFHHGSNEEITGCLNWECTNSEVVLGSFPSDFLELVKMEGVGRLTSGEYATKYLHWTKEKGYWLTDEPLDSVGNKLIPFQTAASSVLSIGKKFIITDCGFTTVGNIELSSDVCGKLSAQTWEITDRFGTTAAENHIDLYIGEEDRENYLSVNPYIIAVENARVKFLN